MLHFTLERGLLTYLVHLKGLDGGFFLPFLVSQLVIQAVRLLGGVTVIIHKKSEKKFQERLYILHLI